jgi:LPS-assembly protein
LKIPDNPFHRLYLPLLCSPLLMLSVVPGHADQMRDIDQGLNWAYCEPDAPAHDLTTPAPPLTLAPPKPQIEADEMQYDQNQSRTLLLGSVQLWQEDQYAQADRVIYHQDSRAAELFGHLFIQQQGLRITAQEGQLQLGDNKGWLSDTEFRLTDSNARGSATRAEMIDKDRSRYEQVDFTTCPPGRKDWSIRAAEMEIDLEKGWGSAKHARLNLGGVPILYAPYFTFPVDDRRMSGLLVPTLGSSESLGLELQLPYYFNLAPNYDATLTPRWMSERGVMLGGEFRYLGEHQKAEISGEILPDDRVESTTHGDQRRALRFYHTSQLATGLTTRIDTTSVSDNDYLDDFGTGLAITSTRHLERVGEIVYRQANWQLLGRLQEFQTVDSSLSPNLYPYRRLPQLLATYSNELGGSGFDLDLSSEYTDFQHDTLINGKRFTLRPALSLPLRRPWGYLTPRLSLNYATYRLDEERAPDEPRPDYFVPAFSLDSGLVFERESSWFGAAATQTLEPRLYYLYAPYDEQSDIPDFDTADLTLSYANLFKENRFSGSDRFGDAKQFALGVTSRWLQADSGLERLRASIGQIYYLQDREVQLTGPTEENTSSSLVAEFSTRVGSYWRGLLTLRRDSHLDEKQFEAGRLGIHYRSPKQHLLNLDYNYSRDTIEDLDLSFNWPFNHRFSLTGKWKYSYLYERKMNRILGFEYGGSCCWKLRAYYQRYVADEDVKDLSIEEDRRFMLQLELKGLGNVGAGVDANFEEYIYGYQAEQ